MSRWTIVQWLTCGFLLISLCIIALLFAKSSIRVGMFFSLAPFLLIAFAAIVTNPYWGLVALFVINYFIMGISRYVSTTALGVSTDAMIILTIASFIYQAAFKGDISWERAKNNPLIKLLAVWLVFCLIEVINPSSVFQAWMSTIRPYAIYPFFTVLFATLLFNRYNALKTILNLWSVFTLLAFIKLIIQEQFGFDNAELRWLLQGGGSTHILSTGTRYFSFFTDAGNFGSNMGCAMVVFSICAMAVKNKGLKLYYMFIAMIAAYSMFLSGTRGALAVPFAGYIMYILLSKNVKSMVVVGFLVIGSFVFFNYTSIGQGNATIRRMRTAFDMNDASLNVRKENQKILSVYMKTKPFGEGLGLSGTEAIKYAPGRITTLPNDSWFVKIWVETGIVGLYFHIGLLLFAVGYGAFIILK
ncbi:MAG: O-antigen ligase family protein, partial [Bacteroidales bacterium]|nr:O-antigen ligase family protein [Bacteroidales bacterium]